MLQGAAGNLAVVSDAALDARLQALAVDLALADANIAPPAVARKRSRKVFRGIVLTVVGILFAAQTGGLTLLLCVSGVMDLIDVLEEDAAAVRLQTRLRAALEQYNGVYQRIAIERSRRDW